MVNLSFKLTFVNVTLPKVYLELRLALQSDKTYSIFYRLQKILSMDAEFLNNFHVPKFCIFTFEWNNVRLNRNNFIIYITNFIIYINNKIINIIIRCHL